MDSRFYLTLDVDIQGIAHAVENEYRIQGYEAQHFGDANQVFVQLKKESTLRTITGLNKALTISLQRLSNGTLLKVGAQEWVDQIAVGAVGLVIHPLLITAAVGAFTQENVVHAVFNVIDNLIRQQQPQVQMGIPPVGV